MTGVFIIIIIIIIMFLPEGLDVFPVP